MFSGRQLPRWTGGAHYHPPKLLRYFLEEACVLAAEIQLVSPDGIAVDRISAQRLARLQDLGFIRRVKLNKLKQPIRAHLWPRNGESVLDRLKMQAYSFQERLDIYRVWRLMHISKKDRPVFQMSVTDNLVYVDPVTGAKRQAA